MLKTFLQFVHLNLSQNINILITLGNTIPKNKGLVSNYNYRFSNHRFFINFV